MNGCFPPVPDDRGLLLSVNAGFNRVRLNIHTQGGGRGGQDIVDVKVPYE